MNKIPLAFLLVCLFSNIAQADTDTASQPDTTSETPAAPKQNPWFQDNPWQKNLSTSSSTPTTKKQEPRRSTLHSKKQIPGSDYANDLRQKNNIYYENNIYQQQ